MTILERPLTDALLLQPDVFKDQRGTFIETYKERQFQELASGVAFVQDNESTSLKGALRGLHFQAPPHAQTKLIRVVHGKILDVIVDCRPQSPTYGQHFAVELSAENHLQLLVPKGLAHGFLTLSETATVNYKVDDYYHPECDAGIAYNDPDLGISWPFENYIISEKDRALPRLKDLKNPF
ncbi:MAG: dTDP-4-dehydrorhamnose 3,5-epimerase [Flavobacteriaceae bacterium]|nr:dTDP-4-dehydrorhamnose 3,5-epimerase [Flavobacteriaceae bacterium]